MSRGRGRTGAILVILAVACSGVLWRVGHDTHMSWDGDNAAYLVVGYAIGSGHGYRMINEPQPPPQRKIAPGYPAAIAAVTMLARPERIVDLVTPLQWINGTLALCIVVLSWWWARQRSSSNMIALLTAWLVAAHPLLLRCADDVMTEIPYVALSLGALVVGERCVYGDQRIRRADWIALVLLSVAAFYVRPIGVLLMVVVFAGLLVAGRGRAAAQYTAWCAALVLPWLVRTYFTPGVAYHNELVNEYRLIANGSPVTAGAFAAQVLGSLAYYWASPAFHLINFGRWHPHIWPLQVVSALVVLVGFARAARGGGRVSEWYVASYVALTMCWPFRDDRFLIPVTPMLLWYWCLGILVCVTALSRRVAILRRPSAVASLLVAVGVLSLGVYTPSHVKRARYIATPWEQRSHHHRWGEYLQAIEWLRQFGTQSDVVLCYKPYLLYVYSGRLSVGYPLADPDTIIGVAAQSGATYVVEDQLEWSHSTASYLVPALRLMERRGWVERAVQFGKQPETVIWRVTPEGRRALSHDATPGRRAGRPTGRRTV